MIDQHAGPAAPTRTRNATAPKSTARRADSTANTAVAFRLSGPLDVTRLRTSYLDVLARHRLGPVHPRDGVDDSATGFATASLFDVDVNNRERRLAVLVQREVIRAFEPGELPVRSLLVSLGRNDAVLVLVADRARWDARSWNVLLDEMSALYNEPTVELGPIPPDDAQTTTGYDNGAAVRHWRALSTPPPNRPELPGKGALRARGPQPADRSAVPIPGDLVEKVRGYAAELGVSAHVVLLAAGYALVHRYTGTKDFVVSTVDSAGRPARLGNFERDVLVRPDFDPQGGFTTLVHSMTTALDTARRHEPGGADSSDRLADIGFRSGPAMPVPDLDGVAARRLSVGRPSIALPLQLTVELGDAGATVTAQCWTAVMDAQILDDFVTAYLHVLREAVRNPQRAVTELDIVTPTSRSAILDSSAGSPTPSAPLTVTELVQQRVASTPQLTAMTADGVDIDYDTLNARANRLAHWLIGRSIGPEDIVGIRLDDLADVVVAILAVLKAGAAYLPLDPDYSDGYIDFLLADSAPRLVLDEPTLADAASADTAATDPTDAQRIRPLRPDNLAYVMYSSGSTGQAKGIQVSHAAIAEHLDGLRTEFALRPDDRLLPTSSIGFDASVLEIFHTLTSGARLIVPRPRAARDYRYIADAIVRHGVTVVHMVPSMLRTFLTLSKVNEWRSVRLIPMGGEPLHGDVADRLATVCDAALSNNYGPTEAIVSATRYWIGDPQGTRTVPIGTPNQGEQLYLLDDSLRLVPDGAIGEIYLGGAQLARGYASAPGPSAARFVADPFHSGGRLFRTGDLARRGGDGNIEFVGRADTRVTVRGRRIELGEVEAVVAAHPAVAHCVVVSTDLPGAPGALAAYLVPRGGPGTVDVGQVHAHVTATLPAELSPSAYAVIEEIPVTAHGKLDHRALPAPRRIDG